MKLLIITQTIDENDPILGFFCRWVEEFAKHCEKVTVICLGKGEYNLPDNVKVLSLGKEKISQKSKLCKITSKFLFVFNFYKYIWQKRKNYDAVFVHMNPEYVVLGGLFWKSLGKKIGLWYTHRQVNLKLRIAEKLVNKIFTVSKESFQLKSDKVHIMGHGIDIKQFESKKLRVESKDDNPRIEILHVGRITPIKNCDILLKAAEILKEKWDRDFHIQFIGSPTTGKDEQYFESLKKMVSDMNLQDNIDFLGSVPNNKIKEYYFGTDMVVNLSPEGLSDKVVFEAMASKTPILVSNKSFLEIFGEYSNSLMFEEKNPKDLAEKIIMFEKSKNKNEIREFLFNKVKNIASLDKLVKNILSKIES